MMATKALVLVLGASLAQAMELTKENWDKETAGKSVLIKFQAPWCGHCKKLVPDWNKLMSDFAGSKSALVADVDCTAGGKSLCGEIGVRGYPTIKHGDPNNMEDYKGGRNYDALKKFADENLGPSCGPANLDLCDAEKKALIEKFSAMSSSDLEAAIKEKEDAQVKTEADFKTFVDGLQKSYEEANKKKDADLAAIKDSGLGMMKAVKAAGKKEEL